MKKKIVFIALLSLFFTPTFALEDNSYTKETLNKELEKVEDHYVLSSNEKMDEEFLSIIDGIITNDDIEKVISCSTSQCTLSLKIQDVESDQKIVQIDFKDSDIEESPSDDVEEKKVVPLHIKLMFRILGGKMKLRMECYLALLACQKD